MSIINRYNVSEVFTIAKKIEENGYDFYDRAIGIANGEDEKAFFKYLRDEESGHKVLFQKLEDSVKDNEFVVDATDVDDLERIYLERAASSHVFNQYVNVYDYLMPVKNVTDVILLALRFEKDTVDYFTFLKACVKEKEHKADIQKLIDEEKKHVVKLVDELKKYKADQRIG